MSRLLDTRIDRVEGRRMAATAEHGSAAIRPTLRAEAAMGAVIRSALARAGVDAAGATRLCFADEAASPLVAIPDTAILDTAILDTGELQREDANGAPLANVYDRAGADDFEPRILVMARRFAGGQPPDFANASFAELFAWSLAQPAAE
jgi:hypothetical protein